MEHVKLEVRCCCQPQKMLGWLNVSTENLKEEMCLHLPLEPDPFDIPDCHLSDMPTSIRFKAQNEHCVLRIRQLNPPSKRNPTDPFYVEPPSYLAISAEEVPMHTLKRIKGFVEA